MKENLIEIIATGSYLVFPFIALMFWLKKKDKISHFYFGLMVILSILFIYMRFIEPNIINVHENGDSSEIKVVIASDFQLGAYKSTLFLQRVVVKINEQRPDLVLIPGDFVYAMEPEEVEEVFQWLKYIHSPTYAVLGNHDIVDSGGEFTIAEIKPMLEKSVNLIDNEIAHRSINGKMIEIVGLMDLWSGKANYKVLDDALATETDDYTIVLTHNPDTAHELSRLGLTDGVDLLVAGHTHGGQIRIPYLYETQIPTEFEFDKGYSFVDKMKVFVTPGLGETALPLRLFMPPRIDVIYL